MGRRILPVGGEDRGEWCPLQSFRVLRTYRQDEELVIEILKKGYSRIPIYEPSSPGAFMWVPLVLSTIQKADHLAAV